MVHQQYLLLRRSSKPCSKVCHVLKVKIQISNKVFWMRIIKTNPGLCQKLSNTTQENQVQSVGMVCNVVLKMTGMPNIALTKLNDILKIVVNLCAPIKKYAESSISEALFTDCFSDVSLVTSSNEFTMSIRQISVGSSLRSVFYFSLFEVKNSI